MTRAVIDELERQGVEDRDIRTSRFSIRADYQYADDGRRRLTGYQVSHALTVEIANLESVGAAIDALSAAGGDELAFHDIEFAYADPERLREDARRNAVEKLHRHAQQLAAAANRELGPLLDLGDESGTGFRPSGTRPCRGDDGAGASGPHADQHRERNRQRHRAWCVRITPTAAVHAGPPGDDDGHL